MKVEKQVKEAPKINYHGAEREIIFNDGDEHLVPIPVPMPPPPTLKIIDGHNLRQNDQVFRRHKDIDPDTWKNLMYIQRRFETVEACIEELRAFPDKYSKEIAFIQADHDRFINGYWFMCNGVPTYITGANYRYLNYWYAGTKHPEYRSRDRKFFIFLDFAKNDPFCCGVNYPKFRREGATSKVGCFCYHEATMRRGAHVGIQSKDDMSAKRVFRDHIVLRWKKLPFWQKPVHEGTTEPKASLNFFSQARSVGVKGTSANFIDSLESWIDFGSSTAGYYDSDKLIVHYGDEVGKSLECDVYARHLVVKPTLMEGNRYIGMIVNTSTVGDMDKGGGMQFKTLCDGSHFERRNDNGETITGLYNLFIPSFDGFDLEDKAQLKKGGKRYIDKFGNSNIEETKAYLERRRKALREAGDEEGYAEEVRQFPLKWSECFRGNSNECNFNVNILNERLDHYHNGNNDIVEGEFQWVDGVQDSRVIWVPIKGGRFKISYLLPDALSNQWEMVGSLKCPANKRFGCAGGDPFKFDTTLGSKPSNGGGAVFMRYDPSIDDPTGDKELWVSDRFCCTYSYRPRTRELYSEDMIMMCVYYGVEMFPEINVTFLMDHFRNRGYQGYLYFKKDPKTGRFLKNPGDTTLAKVQQDIFGEYYTYIQRGGHRECHDHLLRECLDIRDDMGPFDLFVAGGYALMGCRRQEININSEDSSNVKFHRKFVYK